MPIYNIHRPALTQMASFPPLSKRLRKNTPKNEVKPRKLEWIERLFHKPPILR